jgi:hypothetical protein
MTRIGRVTADLLIRGMDPRRSMLANPEPTAKILSRK